jgi:hypothetical protein
MRAVRYEGKNCEVDSEGGGWRLSPSFQLRSLGRNLFDISYPLSADRRAVLAPGRSGVVTFVADF